MNYSEFEKRLSIKSVHFDIDDDEDYSKNSTGHHRTSSGGGGIYPEYQSELHFEGTILGGGDPGDRGRRPRSKSTPLHPLRKTSDVIGDREGGRAQQQQGISLDLMHDDDDDPHSCKGYKILQTSNMRLSSSVPDLSTLVKPFFPEKF